MDTLRAARIQMEVSLAFHMMFAAVGMALPLMMVITEGRWLRTGDRDALRLAKTWGKAAALLFAIGAVSGTALSFELGLLWPRFMRFAGPLVGAGFALEGYAFFIEAIFLGLYLYGWDRLSPRVHWLCGWPVAIAGGLSGVLVLSVNSWMQSPVGFDVGPDGLPTNVDPVAALFNPAWGVMATHSTLSTYQSVGFAAAGVYAWALLRRRRPARAHYNRLAIVIAMTLAAPAAFLQPVVGDFLARRAHVHQPAKLAAAEGQFQTERGAPLRILGWPDPEARETRWAIELPGLLSFLAAHDFNAEVKGLEAFPRDQWPETRLVHPAFQIMVGSGILMMGVAAWYWWRWLRAWQTRRHGVAPPPASGDSPVPRQPRSQRASGQRRDWSDDRWLLWGLVLSAPLGFLALQTGWIVTEVGRQPWVIYGVMRTRDAVTPAVEVGASLSGFAVLYTALGVVVVVLLRRLARGEADDSQHAASDEEHAGPVRPAPGYG